MPDPAPQPPASTASDAGVETSGVVTLPGGGCAQGSSGPLAVLGLLAGGVVLLRRRR